jgi:hypothetical protein
MNTTIPAANVIPSDAWRYASAIPPFRRSVGLTCRLPLSIGRRIYALVKFFAS